MAGLLDSVLPAIFSAGNKAQRVVRGLLADPVGTAQMNLDRVLPTDYESRQSYEAQRGRPANPVAVADARKKLEQMYQDAALGAITVWHGSPHKFDKFDMSKIGTGEGAQAYGHGLYFAESPKVAEEYAQVLDPLASVAKGSIDADGTAARVLQAVGFDKTRAINELTRRKNMTHVAGDAEWAKKMDDAIAFIQGQDKTSNLYKVDLPDEAVARFLDWDKPLSQQAPEVQAVINDFNLAEHFGYKLNEFAAKTKEQKQKLRSMVPQIPATDLSINGEQLYNRMFSTNEGKEGASAALRASGIPGIRYLDGGSRGTGTGTSNFVVFDDQLPTILERNGVPLRGLLK